MAGNQQYNNSNFLYLQQEIFYLSERLNSLIGQQNNSAGVAAISLLAKATVNLNPIISCTYTGLTGSFLDAETITDANGSTAIVVSSIVSGIVTLTSINMVSPHQSFSGTITGGTSGASASAGTFSWGDQQIKLAGGNNFADINLIISALTGEDAPPIAKDLEVWSGTGRTGTLYFSTNIGGGVDALQNLLGYSNYISVLSGDIRSVTSPKLYVPSVLYITLSTVEQVTETVQLVVNGTIQN